MRYFDQEGAAIRSEAGIGPEDPLEPREYVSKHLPKVRVLSIDEVPGAPIGALLHLLGPARRKWSAATIEVPSGFVIMMNPSHDPERQRVTLMEEVVHIRKGHKPTKLVVCKSTGLRTRSFDKAIEKEAYGIGAAALLPLRALVSRLQTGKDAPSIGREFGVSHQLVEYRIKITGNWGLYSDKRAQGA